MIFPPNDDEVRQLYQKYVPEVAAGMVEVMAVARDPGSEASVAEAGLSARRLENQTVAR